MNRHARLNVFASICGILPLAAFAESTTATAVAPALAGSAAIVPGADVYFSFDMVGARKSPLYLELEKKDEKPELVKKMKDATGLDRTDILGLSGSVDIDGIDFGGQPSPEQMANLPAVMSVKLGKAISKEQMKNGLTIAMNEGPGMDFADAANGLVKATPKGEQPNKNAMYSGLAGDGKQIFVGANEKSVLAAIARSSSGKLEILPAGLAAVAAGTSHVQVSVLLPKIAKDGIAKAIDEAGAGKADAGSVMMAGMLAPLKGLSKVAIKAMFNPADIGLSFVADLSQPEAAAQANMMLNTMVMPMLAQGLGQDASKPSRIKVDVQGSLITLRGNMTRDEVMNAGKAAAGAAGGALGAPEDGPDPFERK